MLEVMHTQYRDNYSWGETIVWSIWIGGYITHRHGTPPDYADSLVRFIQSVRVKLRKSEDRAITSDTRSAVSSLSEPWTPSWVRHAHAPGHPHVLNSWACVNSEHVTRGNSPVTRTYATDNFFFCSWTYTTLRIGRQWCVTPTLSELLRSTIIRVGHSWFQPKLYTYR